MNGRLTPRQVATLDAKKLASAQQQAERELQELQAVAERRNDYENEITRKEAREVNSGY